MKPFKVGDKVRTCDGREARIFMVDGGGPFPIIGAIRAEHLGTWSATQWREDGCIPAGVERHPSNLVRVPKTQTVEFDLVLWPDGGLDAFPDWARLNSQYGKPFAVKHLTVTFEEGEGL